MIQGKSGLPIFVGVMAFAVKAVIDKAAERDGLNPGDVWIFNDPYDGGTHLSDFRLVKPVFHDGELFCFLASVGHWHDVGGNVPGNYNPAATEAFQEGMLIPPVKLYDRGEFRQILSISFPPTVVCRCRFTAISTGRSMRWISARNVSGSYWKNTESTPRQPCYPP